MKHTIIYRERANRTLMTEEIYAGAFLWWVYNNMIGRMLEYLFLRYRFLLENYRMITLLDSDHFGTIGIVEVGAFTVGSICQQFKSHRRVARGQHKGWFELGGSTVVLLFEKAKIQLDEDLCRDTEQGIETFVRFGQPIGRAVQR